MFLYVFVNFIMINWQYIITLIKFSVFIIISLWREDMMIVNSLKVNRFLSLGFERTKDYSSDDKMTILGVRNKSLILLLIMVLFTVTSWWVMSTNYINSYIWLILLGIGMIVPLVIVTIISPKSSLFTGFFYAIGEGFLLAGISLQGEKYFEGIVMPFILLSISMAFSMLLIYRYMAKLNSKFAKRAFIVLVGIMISYLITFMASTLGADIPFIHTKGIIGALLSIFVITIALSSLLINFDFVVIKVEKGAPKYMEWYSAVSIMVILVFMYLEVLGLFGEIKDRA